ncbi:HAD family hydrolase [Flavicella sediminum]|uniref:HAD family hydrolase n=1 Tax=Flavicella sediminum TaxID=2585141 RepID=UPI001124C853|nr:HAD-IA family hydrolase [Flavicella sediminum]
MNIEGIIFDLDGTLVNSIADIAYSMNVVLEASSYPTHSYEAYETFIGSGIRNLVGKALPADAKNEKEIDRVFDEMFRHYKDNCINKTAVYQGVMPLLEQLQKTTLKMAVLSNKADALTKKVVTHTLPAIFNPVIGLTTEALKKPNPEVVLNICKELGLNVNNTLYVGDTSVDIQTAKNAGLISVAVTWGFRSKASLVAEKPDYIIDSPEELLDLLS